MRATYRVTPGERLEVEIVQADGGRALVTGILDSVPETAHGSARRLRVTQARVEVLPAEG